MKIRSSAMAEIAMIDPISLVFIAPKSTVPIHAGRRSWPESIRVTKFS